MKLFGSYTSPYVRHCRLVLAQTALDWDFIETDYAASAAGSPTRRVPYLQDNDLTLHDSSSIVHYLRDKQGQAFLPTPQATEAFALVNTVLETLINLFLLKNNGIADRGNDFLQRQHARVHDTLTYLDARAPNHVDPQDDAALRLACLLDWAQFRGRITLVDYPNLSAFLALMNTWDNFAATAPNIAI